MKIFHDVSGARAAMDFAAAGGQALHVFDSTWATRVRPLRGAFRIYGVYAHLMDNDRDRLIKTARMLGVRKIVVDRVGRRGQHVDLCGAPLNRAIAQCEKEKPCPMNP